MKDRLLISLAGLVLLLNTGTLPAAFCQDMPPGATVRTGGPPDIRVIAGHGFPLPPPGPFMMPPPGIGGFAMHPPMMPPPREFLSPFDCLDASELNLSDDQIEKIAQLKRDMRTQMQFPLSQIRTLEQEIALRATDATVQPAELSRIHKLLAEQRSTIDKLQTDSLIATAQLLTAEQRHKLRMKLDRSEFGHFEGMK